MTSTSYRASVTTLLIAASFAVTACGALGSVTGPQETVFVTSVVTTVDSPGGVQGGVADGGLRPGDPALVDPAGENELSGVVAGVPGEVGIAVAPVGGSGQVITAGSWRSGVAWSTIKVPLAIAAERSDPTALNGAATAITMSDNAAAERLWNALGGGATSSAAISGVLADAGDHTTQVPSTVTRPGYSIFGQTRWSLEDQARFGSRVPCLGSSGRVVDLMGQIAPDQAWGLGRIPGSRFKGGWGPGESGGYLVRQFGLVPAAGGDVAVSLAVDAPTFADGTETLSRIAAGLAPLLPTMRGGAC